jgi:hypothetical protein
MLHALWVLPVHGMLIWLLKRLDGWIVKQSSEPDAKIVHDKAFHAARDMLKRC